ncbi:MAG: hypothetical protein AB4368_03010 [Xenococcaceae cyanobacterium]
MNKNELKRKLEQKNVRGDSYSLEGGFPNEAYCLNNNGALWEVYYSERGQKTELETFNEESEACDYFYNLLIEDLNDMGLL